MLFIVGFVEQRTDQRYILSGEASPALRDVKDLSDGGGDAKQYDWGLDATEEAAYRTAFVILKHIADEETAKRLHQEYAIGCVRVQMKTGHCWILSADAIARWIEERVLVQ